MEYQLLIAVGVGIFALLFMILKLKIQAFIALLIVCILVGIIAGLSPEMILDSIKNGMGGTLGFVATVVGLGALFGGLLEHSGGAQGLARYILKIAGEKNASWAMMITGFIIAIPVFFDVAFIILVPVVYAIARNTKKSVLLYAIPLLAGLAITHSFIPPTPGPVAVADILGANLGWVIILGFITGIPAAIISGPVFAKYVSKKISVSIPEQGINILEDKEYPNPITIIAIIALPILLIVLKTIFLGDWMGENFLPESVTYSIALLGHPFTALIIANLLAWYILGIRRGTGRDELLKLSMKSFQPAGAIILLTGAGGAFKQILVDTKAGEILASSLQGSFIHPLLFAFIVAALIRILQGSATTAMIAAAGIASPIILIGDFSAAQIALFVISIASGATILSHVNDSGFWLVGQYLGLTEKQTFRSWTVMTTLIACTGLIMSLLLWYVF
ncbi:Gnt-I system low-affinity gluconate transporter [Aquimarina sp. EL_43]|uniref:GntP family permease n=1 Tax=unclassified Aquimarina TaxID=2627091 RepID=UPI0018C9A3C6|nr:MULTISPECIES: gluconate:H+ symporter [unclassified Aquimarina]MBG6129711.1 Gnt-I system low-affinity gluconate transporter [Aquimarina sp. EL_35]MBG6150776.1 Gnt-I system low-affinity gluconate transporter [Aquimarina sp. EL_32]MBG6167917.1 Gnt-I system low-affinity gluconate transporter [Aquimarina sp. EL_43]